MSTQMDIIALFIAYISVWLNTLHITIGAAIAAIAILYFTKDINFKNRIGISAIIGILISILGTGLIIPAGTVPQLYYPLTIFALGSGTSLAYLAVSEIAGQKLGWIPILFITHLASYITLLLTGIIPLISESMLGIFIGIIPAALLLSGIFLWCAKVWNPKWTPWWISGDIEGRNTFLRKLKRKKT